jgi:phosphoglucosamine mutase
MEHIFRAYDIRGVFNEELTTDFGARIGEVFAAFHGHEGKLAIGRDVRISSDALESAVAAGMAAGGLDVVSVGACPIPVLNFHVDKGEYVAGVYITASHNPPEYNGIRWRNPDGSGYTYDNQRVKEMYLAGGTQRPQWDRVGNVSRLPEGQAIAEYTQFLVDRLTAPRPLKIVVDPGNGAATLVAQDLLRRVGHQVVSLFGEVDGTFPNRSPHPTEKSLGALMEAVREHGADMGVGYDADGDRCVFVDDKGRAVQVEKVGILVSRDLLKDHKGKVIANVPCSMIVEEELEKDGAEVVRVRVGDVFVCEEIKKHNGIFAMEISAHFFLPTYYIFDDPMLMTLKLAELLGADDKPLSTVVDAIPSYPFIEEGFKCPDDIKFRVNELLEDHFRAQGARIDTTDGVKVIFDDSWAMLRPSNTQPLIRLFAEARTQSRLDELVAEFTRLFHQMQERAAAERT